MNRKKRIMFFSLCLISFCVGGMLGDFSLRGKSAQREKKIIYNDGIEHLEINKIIYDSEHESALVYYKGKKEFVKAMGKQDNLLLILSDDSICNVSKKEMKFIYATISQEGDKIIVNK